MNEAMEIRDLRYFLAVAEAGSFAITFARATVAELKAIRLKARSSISISVFLA